MVCVCQADQGILGMDRWMTILFIWYMWIGASSILLIVIGKFNQAQYTAALAYLAVPTFVYLVYYAKRIKARGIEKE